MLLRERRPSVPRRARCSQGLSVPSRSHLSYSQRRDPQWTRRESLAVRVPEEAPLPVEVVPDAALPLQTAGAFSARHPSGSRGVGRV